MNLFLENLTKRHPRLACALYAWKHGGDIDYVKRAMRQNPLVMQARSLGPLNKDKNIYYIEFGDPSDGFFAEYGKLLKYLYYADRFGLSPVVRFTEKFLYAEKDAVNGSINPFEYYYEQPSGIGVGEALKSRNVIYAEYIHTQIRDLVARKKGDYGVSDKYISVMARVDRKYIRLNKVVGSYIDKEINKIGVNQKTIGLHFRGTDYKRELELHPVYAKEDVFIKKAMSLLDTGKYDRIFVATDDAEALEKMKNKFGSSLCFYDDTFRSSGDVSVAFLENRREHHHYKLGLEVLRDMETLSSCGALIAGVSQVSLAARITNLSHGKPYRDLEIIDFGTVENKTNWRRAEKYYDSVMRKDSGGD